jgi:hypothetical protein
MRLDRDHFVFVKIEDRNLLNLLGTLGTRHDAGTEAQRPDARKRTPSYFPFEQPRLTFTGHLQWDA